jgi:hypothetical protein
LPDAAWITVTGTKLPTQGTSVDGVNEPVRGHHPALARLLLCSAAVVGICGGAGISRVRTAGPVGGLWPIRCLSPTMCSAPPMAFQFVVAA